jgi:hypothetical protein
MGMRRRVAGVAGKGQGGREKEALLFEKRSKNFCWCVCALDGVNSSKIKVFWFFFSKKNRFPYW